MVVGRGRPLLVIAGPCVIESAKVCLDVAGAMRDACRDLGLPYVFKASFDKANRSSGRSFRGLGIVRGLRVLAKVKDKLGVPVLTDIHQPEQAAPVARVVDVLQIPAFLCRQTDLLVAAARTGLPVNIKKGQFLSPAEMKNVVEKVTSAGGNRVLLCERGTFFGYNDLVVDMRSIPLMQQLGWPVIFDATHSTQSPGGLGDRTGGRRDMAPVLARAAVAAGADGVFIETHPNPDRALSDSATMLPLDSVADLLGELKNIAAASAGR
jgi:2-dehydro-3-deoxyphosphooctonate aldolase (KDO 8-P synthase)